MATHSSILAWRIPRTEEPGGVHGVSQSQTRLNDLAHPRRGFQPLKSLILPGPGPADTQMNLFGGSGMSCDPRIWGNRNRGQMQPQTGLISDSPHPCPSLSSGKPALWAFSSCEGHFHPLFGGKILI